MESGKAFHCRLVLGVQWLRNRGVCLLPPRPAADWERAAGWTGASIEKYKALQTHTSSALCCHHGSIAPFIFQDKHWVDKGGYIYITLRIHLLRCFEFRMCTSVLVAGHRQKKQQHNIEKTS